VQSIKLPGFTCFWGERGKELQKTVRRGNCIAAKVSGSSSSRAVDCGTHILPARGNGREGCGVREALPRPSLWEIRRVKLLWQADDSWRESTRSTQQRGDEGGLCYGKRPCQLKWGRYLLNQFSPVVIKMSFIMIRPLPCLPLLPPARAAAATHPANRLAADSPGSGSRSLFISRGRAAPAALCNACEGLPLPRGTGRNPGHVPVSQQLMAEEQFHRQTVASS